MSKLGDATHRDKSNGNGRVNSRYHIDPVLTAKNIQKEVKAGLRLLETIDRPIVTIFGSHRLGAENYYYGQAMETAARLGELGYAIITGGGPGIMEAANVGASSVGAPSIGLLASLIKDEQSVFTDIHTHKMSFEFMFVRRFIMTIKSDAILIYPGGYGTLNEKFEQAVLMQTDLVDRVPIVLIDEGHWGSLLESMRQTISKQNLLINGDKDLDGLLTFANTPLDAVRIVQGEEFAGGVSEVRLNLRRARMDSQGPLPTI